MKFSLFSAVLFSIGWMSVVASGNGPPPNCCLTVSKTRPPAENIVKYEMQEQTTICTLKAVIFHTKSEKAICSDPDSKYAKRVMEIVDGRTTAKSTMCYTSTTNTIPAVTTTNETPGKKTETSTSTTASQIVTRIETSRPETETSRSTTASRIVTTIETSRPETETSMSTTASRIVTTIETSRPETETTKTTNQPTSVSKENSESSLRAVTTCGTGGPTSPSTETRSETPGIGTVTHLNTLNTLNTTDNTETTSRVTNKTSPRKTKLSKLIIRKNGKSKKRLRQFQMGKHGKK